MIFVLVGISLQPVWLGISLSWLFGYKLGWTPIVGYCDAFAGPPLHVVDGRDAATAIVAAARRRQAGAVEVVATGSATIREALGRAPPRPGDYADLESRPQRFDVIDPDADAVKAYIAQHASA